MTHTSDLMSPNSMGSSWCCIETPSLTTLSLPLNSESDKMLESFNSSSLQNKNMLYLKIRIMPEIKSRILPVLFIFSLLIYVGGKRETKISRFFKRKWLIFTYHCSYYMKRKLWLIQPSCKPSLCSHFSKLICIQNNNAGQMHHIYHCLMQTKLSLHQKKASSCCSFSCPLFSFSLPFLSSCLEQVNVFQEHSDLP